MGEVNSKKLDLLRILQIFHKYSDREHPLLQEDVAYYLENDYGITLERKAISRKIALLQTADDIDIVSDRKGSGCYLQNREFLDAELRMLIDGVLSSKYITSGYSKDLIEKLCGLSSQYFRSHVKNVFSVNDWGKTDNQQLFLNIEGIDDAIESRKQIQFDYNKYGVDKKLHKTSSHHASPYQLILHNQRYYLMACNERWHNMAYYRLDRITNLTVTDRAITPVREVEGFKKGIDYKELSSARPYMYTDKPERVTFIADASIVDQIVDWFGTEVKFRKLDENKVEVQLFASPYAMEHWAMQYINFVEVTKPDSLRERIKENLKTASEKYK